MPTNAQTRKRARTQGVINHVSDLNQERYVEYRRRRRETMLGTRMLPVRGAGETANRGVRQRDTGETQTLTASQLGDQVFSPKLVRIHLTTA